MKSNNINLSNYYVEVAQKLISEGKFFEAIENLSEAIDLNPYNENALYHRAQISFLIFQDYEGALEDLNQVIAINKEYFYAYLTKGQILLDLGLFEQSIEIYCKAIQYKSDSGIAFYLIGKAFEKNGHYQEALDNYEKAIKVEPKNPDFYYAKGFIYVYLGKYEEAIECYSKALDLGLKNYNVYYEKSLALYLLNKYEEAFIFVCKAIEIDPHKCEGYNLRANINLYLNKDISDVIKDYSWAIKINSKYIEAYLSRGTAYALLADYKTALEDILQVELLNTLIYKPLNESKKLSKAIYFNKGRIYSKLENFNQAIIEFSKSLDIEKNTLSYYNRALCYSAIQKYRESIIDYSSAIDLLSNSEDWLINEIYLQRGLVYESLGDIDNAIIDYHQVLSFDASCNEALLLIQKFVRNNYISSNDSINQILQVYRQTRSLEISEKNKQIAIQNICSDRKIDYLFHFTQKTNLINILNQGLLSREFLNKNKYDYTFNDHKRLDGYINAICLTIGFPQYQMFFKYSKKNQNNWVILLLDPSILWLFDCAFCSNNAASRQIKSIPIEELKNPNALNSLFNQNFRDINLPSYYPTNPQSEVLVFDSIPPSFIQKIHFYDEDSYNEWCRSFKDFKTNKHSIEVSKQYFKRRLDWEKWWKNY